jgi:hypothetical protein
MVHQPTITKLGTGRTIGVVGDIYRFLAVSEDTDGRYVLWEAIVPPGGGPPPHVHSREEEFHSSPDAFVAELQRRSAAYRSGATRSRSADEVLIDMYKRQAGEET